MTTSSHPYYVPSSSHWPIIGSFSLFITVLGAASFIQQSTDKHVAVSWLPGHVLLFLGLALIAIMMFGWFSNVIKESQQGTYTAWEDRSFRMSMMWFIISEVMFFAAFFGALFYSRLLSVPWLGGEGVGVETHLRLWPNFIPDWPLLETPGGKTTQAMGPWGVPLLNTIILVSSSVTLTYAHWALKFNQRTKLIAWLALTVLLGAAFLYYQVEEYMHAYNELGLTLQAGIYGTTFFMLTGFHGMHVTIGATMLLIMLIRVLRGHFTPQHHFAFEATCWYWHFVDVVWLFLFTFVYWL